MNKDKVIKDLKKHNDSLNNQYRLRDIRCIHLENEIQRQKKEIENLKKENKILRENADHNDKVVDKVNWENNILKRRLNDIVFDDANKDVELGARYLRKIGYIDFDEERKVYVNKHNNEPIIQEDEREKDYYIPDEELNEYTKQLEYKNDLLNKIIEKAKHFVDQVLGYHLSSGYEQLEKDCNELFDILIGVDKD